MLLQGSLLHLHGYWHVAPHAHAVAQIVTMPGLRLALATCCFLPQSYKRWRDILKTNEDWAAHMATRNLAAEGTR